MPNPTRPADLAVVPERVYLSVCAAAAAAGAQLYDSAAVRSAVAVVGTAAVALVAASHVPAFRGRPQLAAGAAFRLAAAAVAQTALTSNLRVALTAPTTMIGFLVRRNMPILHFVSVATLRTESPAAFVAIAASELAVFTLLQQRACVGIVRNLPSTAFFYDRLAAIIRHAALAPVVGSTRAAAGACPASACHVVQTFCFALATVLGAAAAACGGRRRLSVAGIAIGIYAAAVLAVAAAQVARGPTCAPLPPHHAAALAAGPPVAAPLLRGATSQRMRLRAQLAAADVAAAARFVAAGARGVVLEVGRALFL